MRYRSDSRTNWSTVARQRRDRRFYALLESLEDRTVLSTDSFVNLSGGDWFTASNWSSGQIPQAGDDVAIPALSAGAAVTYALGSGQTAPSLSSMALNGPLVISGPMTVSGSVSGTGNLTLAGNFQGGGGILNNANISGLTVIGDGGGLNGVTLSGGAKILADPNALSQGCGDIISVTNGLTINGTVSLGNASTRGSFFFPNSQTISGSGTILSNQGIIGNNAR